MNVEATYDDSGERSRKTTELESSNGAMMNIDSRRIGSSQMSLSRDNCEDDGTNSIEPHRSESSISASSSWRRNSLSFSRGVAPRLVDDDYESEIVSHAGDIGDRAIHSNRNSKSGSVRQLSMDNVVAIENGFALLPEAQLLETYGFWFKNSNGLNTTSPISPLPSEIVSPLSTDAILYSKDESPRGLLHTSVQPVNENQKQLPPTLEYISCLVHLAVFGIFGGWLRSADAGDSWIWFTGQVLTRYLLQKLFGPTVAGVTSDQTALYLDLPSNMLGSFLMGWLGVVFKGNICRVSDFLAIGLTTGYLGSLTTFSGWNQKMLDLSVQGKWVVAAVECLLGMFLVAMSIAFGIETARGFRWLLDQWDGGSQSSKPNSSSNWRVDTSKRHLLVIIVLLLALGSLWGISGALFSKQLNDGNTNAQLWLACLVAPPGVWIRWLLARLNGRGLGKAGMMKWIPFGTLIANVSAACIMAGLAAVKKLVNNKKCEIISAGIQLGFLGCLSTVSTFIAEYHAMSQSSHSWRAHLYAAITILPSFGLGTLIYSIPVWTKA